MKIKPIRKKLKKFLLISIICFISICYTNNFVFAANGLNVNAFENPTAEGTEKVTNLVNSTAGAAVSVIRIVAASIAVIMLLVIAMRYMISSPGDRADIKKHAVAYVIGAFVLFGVTGILGVLVDLSNTFNS
ncbi:MAG TPA: hypothetical protein IAD08_02245 [Candidatus Scatovivens faecipullorum]|nr:hypothetical protein [Candidatus Scatovivens faecipullorum]